MYSNGRNLNSLLKNKFLSSLSKNNKKVLDLKDHSDILMREYVERKLYLDGGYYSSDVKTFAEENFTPIGKLDKPLNFQNMRGMGDYAKELNAKYPKSTWLTCSELLRPYFGYAVGNYMLSKHLKSSTKGMKIIEVGCGMGGAIDSILEYLKNFNIKQYREVEYVGLEMTKSLCDSTEKLLRTNHPELYENGQITVINNSLYDFHFNEENRINEDCFILAFNFIDSIGHDKVKVERGFKDFLKNEILTGNLELNNQDMTSNSTYDIRNIKDRVFIFLEKNKEMVKETHVVKSERDNSLTQIYKPIQDEKLKEMLFYNIMLEYESESVLGSDFLNLERGRIRRYEDWFVKLLRKVYNFTKDDEFIWLPTESINFFYTLRNSYPNHSLVLLDFDFISSKMFNCDYKGKNSPAVYSIKENSLDSITHPSIFSSYSNTQRPVNIYFPVDFQLLQLMYKIITNKLGTVNKFKYLMTEYSMSEWCETRSGFNPLVDTHHNLSFLLTI